MFRNKKNTMLRLLATVLVIAMVLPFAVGAETVQPRASAYLDSYEAYIYPVGNGKVQIYYTVIGTRTIDELGVMRITLYESTDNSTWSWVKTFTQSGTPSLMGYNDYLHSGHVTYRGVAGRYYKAYVCVWGGDNGAGDNRYFWTSAKRAT